MPVDWDKSNLPPAWITGETRRQPVRSRSITFRVTEAELRAISDEADRTRTHVSHLLRKLALDSVGKNPVLDEGQIGYRPTVADIVAKFREQPPRPQEH